ncbi:hypothetical protein BDF20DRAFT_828984 [Mycotypha africana]|uniref:uncharacterized protein n=1 Tax=Mycotypha africana TaxID=64632 RepID=UPI00230188CD|nr:uncharacterized protein BDF20DRAFT_828984 [Mycotypha africana]KAI8967819.1 hypothetical protein BDF20DRAFT_828984 [Mycotypha africana]
MSCYEHINSKINSTTVPPAAVVVTAASSQATQQEQTERLDDQTERLNRLELDLQTLNQKYVAEIEKRAQVQHEKEALELELDDLCSKLFEEANDMVAAEKKLRSQVEDELKETKERLLWEQSQLNELRMKLLDNDNSTTTTTTTTTSSGSRRSMHLSSFPPPPMTFDQYQLQLFTEYVETVSTNTSLPQKKQFQLPFMKLTLLEDIEPCLRFHPLQQPVRKLSSKKIIDHLYKETCLIEYVPTTTTTTAKNICQACNRKQPPINYRFKLNEKETEWLWIDQYCRDRLVAVCEYFVFMRNIQHGFLNHITSIQELYNENIRLKLQMFYSR